MRINISSFKKLAPIFAILLAVATLAPICGALSPFTLMKAQAQEEIVLRVCNWEEYIDLGEWDEEEVIDLESGDIFGENPLYEDFEEWYYEKTGVRVRVEYSCFGTNEELYNMLTIGDVYDLVCPSDYMLMKLAAEDMVVPFSEEFLDESNPDNYYINGVSPYIRNLFDTYEINGIPWSKFAAGYMWGVVGFLYNPDAISAEEVSTWKVLINQDYYRKITVKDNVRDTYFATLGAIKSDLLLSDEFRNAPDYSEKLFNEMNDVSEETLAEALEYLKEIKNNTYSFETDSGKADMITGKVVANPQWSGDAVYAMDQAEEDDYFLEFAVPEEVTDVWFDGWVMLKGGIGEDKAKKQAAEAFINYLSMPENAVRNMYYIGYTSVIAGGDSDVVYEYIDWNYSADEDASEDEIIEYPVGYFFSGIEDDENYIITAYEDQGRRQLFAQYPTKDVINRAAVMWYYDTDEQARVNQMWINVRCVSVKDIPWFVWVIGGSFFIGLVFLIVRSRIKNR